MTHPKRTPVVGPDIEALARVLTDEQWDDLFVGTWRPFVGGPASGHHPWTLPVHFTGDVAKDSQLRVALLAYLDEVWAGLTKAPREWLAVLCDDGFATSNHRSHSLTLRNLVDKRLATNLITREPTPAWARQFEPLPLGRAVLKRAKEQGR